MSGWLFLDCFFMQTILAEHTDKIRKLRTTDGINKIVSISPVSDDGMLYITLKAKGIFRIKLGYYYTFHCQKYDPKLEMFTKEMRQEKLDKYIVIEGVLNGKDSSISIPIGWNWTSGYEDEKADQKFWDDHDGEGYIDVFDVLKLECLTEP
ncbi:hypothetical protein YASMINEVIRUS_620 [Yasminevirus sp. GU-2018]|uniref:Uncharacterized protein n=1 Tax=Yasminevirus sp. GU-2018 TaxID=2420051 RepID=A0A5K0U8F5_9VIRU|nr:hypothetical protein YASMINEVIRUS_620 [Yasminevirus sp. GU-2018]